LRLVSPIAALTRGKARLSTSRCIGFRSREAGSFADPSIERWPRCLGGESGIYGNCIVIDHGFGLQSIYGHLSEFLVKKGDDVKKGQIIGKTGSTGLAGGDHLHFTMQIDGVQVNSVEWWIRTG